MEQQLTNLIAATSEAKRTSWAKDFKSSGGKVIGTLCSYVPEEIIYAAGMLPWYIAPVTEGNITKALVHRVPSSSQYCNAVLESLMNGQLDFLDGVVATDREQDLVRLWDVWVHLGKTPFAHIMHVPSRDDELGCRQMAKDIRSLTKALEDFGGRKITDDSLRQATKVLNKTRLLLSQMYELRKRQSPAVSGSEAMTIVAAATVMPKERFNKELESLLPYLEHRKVPSDQGRPRILVSSDTLDRPSYIELVEQAGAVVAMDDLDPGSRYFWLQVDGSAKDLPYALAKRYLNRPGHPRMFAWDKQVQQIVDWVRDFRIDGVLELVETFSLPREFRVPVLHAELTKAGIPNMSIPRQRDMADAGQIGTRIQAFVEMLQAKKA
ncbi:MAG: 2-hydroxyacyl-CoA dehydratase family protein [Dehalococcoidia bacterium]|nr:2-hydroxyacyl-CoA dehydratase family protein [Dehalococcoidia bacterium]